MNAEAKIRGLENRVLASLSSRHREELEETAKTLGVDTSWAKRHMIIQTLARLLRINSELSAPAKGAEPDDKFSQSRVNE